ncbi:MAG: DUF2264 domain-containing protein [Victivallales bacterium]|nr:DUF2264 domain-containing protein [Victivallales bacterium]
MNNIRQFWLECMLKIATPVLEALSQDALRVRMPVECQGNPDEKKNCTYLEAFGRTLVGMAPWLACPSSDETEEKLRLHYAALARQGLAICCDETKNDCMTFASGMQPIVDAAFLAEGILRAPQELWEPLETSVKSRLLDAMRSTRTRKPYKNNWLLFSAIIECLLHHAKAKDWDPMRIDYALTKHTDWYLGDGWYGDGPRFNFNYYNSFVIQPMLIDVLAEVGDEYKEWGALKGDVTTRASHFASFLEQLISPEGTYPAIGRSLAYRFGAFHALAQAALLGLLPPELPPAQVRSALTAVIQRTMSAKGMFDNDGWLRIGVCGHQPRMGETYISTGSLYLCTTVFLPLGLPAEAPFWKEPDCPWTQKRIWAGEDTACQHAIS